MRTAYFNMQCNIYSEFITVILTCPAPRIEAPCQTQSAINTKFAAWIATASGSGGCNGSLTHSAATAPPSSGGSTTVTFTYTSSCAPLISTCTATFTVSAPATITLSQPKRMWWLQRK